MDNHLNKRRSTKEVIQKIQFVIQTQIPTYK